MTPRPEARPPGPPNVPQSVRDMWGVGGAGPGLPPDDPRTVRGDDEVERLRAQVVHLAGRLGEAHVHRDAFRSQVEALKQIVIDWADHDSWRCYSTRYPGECCCGLDDAMTAAGMGDQIKAAPR